MMADLAGIVLDLDESVYHARPELSSTEARLILGSPARYRWKKDNPPMVGPSKKFDLGTAVHSRVLGTGSDVVVIPAELLASNGAVSTTAGRQFVSDVRASGMVPVTEAEYVNVTGMEQAVLAHPTARALLTQPGSAEASVFAEVDGVQVRARFDYLPTQSDRRLVASDLKTTRDASPRGFTRAIADYQYDVQRSWYLDTLNAVTGPMPYGMEPELVFIAVEKEPPFLVAVYQLPTIWTEMGRVKAARARQVYAECSASGIWPGYSTEIEVLSPPTWLVMQHEEEYS